MTSTRESQTSFASQAPVPMAVGDVEGGQTGRGACRASVRGQGREGVGRGARGGVRGVVRGGCEPGERGGTSRGEGRLRFRTHR